MISSLASLNRLRIYGYNPTETLLESAWLSVKARTTGITLVIKLMNTKFWKGNFLLIILQYSKSIKLLVN